MILGIEIGGTKLQAVLGDASGRIERTERCTVPGEGTEPTCAALVELVGKLTGGAAVERIGLAELADPACRVTVRTPTGRIGPGFRVKGLFIWGFTAALVDRLLTLGGWEVPWNADSVHDIQVDGGPGELFPGTQDRPIP